MYQLPHFTEQDNELIFCFLKEHPFATLIGCNDRHSVATQVPVIITETDGTIKILGHIMRETDHHLAFVKNAEVLLLFTGANCYISSSWYSERGHGSTWNYMTVHVRGTIKFLTEEETIGILSQLTDKYEKQQQYPVLMKDIPEAYIHTLVKYIAGFEIQVHSIHPIFKLSQNRDNESYINIVKNLEAQNDAGAQEIAKEMKIRRRALFDKIF